MTDDPRKPESFSALVPRGIVIVSRFTVGYVCRCVVGAESALQGVWICGRCLRGNLGKAPRRGQRCICGARVAHGSRKRAQ